MDRFYITWSMFQKSAVLYDKEEADEFYHWWYRRADRSKHPITVEKVNG